MKNTYTCLINYHQYNILPEHQIKLHRHIRLHKDQIRGVPQKTSSIIKSLRHPPFLSDNPDRLQLKNMTSSGGQHKQPKHRRQKVYVQCLFNSTHQNSCFYTLQNDISITHPGVGCVYQTTLEPQLTLRLQQDYTGIILCLCWSNEELVVFVRHRGYSPLQSKSGCGQDSVLVYCTIVINNPMINHS